MWRTILFYGAALALLVFGLKFIEYRYLVRDLSMEFYLGLIAVLFTAIGIWTGIRLTRQRRSPSSGNGYLVDEDTLQHLGISKREHEVLELMAEGCSNQEIADRLFVSVNTVKTHSSNLFSKLGVSRRTQAIQKAKRLRLIP
jgi:two-component system, NarL family, response regulator LiaR